MIKVFRRHLKFYVAMIFVLMSLSCCTDESKTVVCWGDSLTAPHNSGVLIATIKEVLMGNSLAYPEHMQRDWAGDYNIINAGVGGENTLTIMSRQGVFPIKLSLEVRFERDDKGEVYAKFPLSALRSAYNDMQVCPLMQYGYDKNSPAQINPCSINDKEYELSITADKKYYVLKPIDKDNYDGIISSGNIIRTFASKNLRNCYAYIFFMGQNGGFANAGELIKQYKAMIDYCGSERYIIIGFHKPNNPMPTISRMKEMEDSLHTAFSCHYINLRDYLVRKGLSDAGLTATNEDNDSMSVGQVPPQLMVDGTHFTNDGYKLISNLVKAKFIELGY